MSEIKIANLESTELFEELSDDDLVMIAGGVNATTETDLVVAYTEGDSVVAFNGTDVNGLTVIGATPINLGF